MDLRERPAGSFVRHPWEVARAHFYTRLVAKRLPPAPTVLDVGAGDGYLAGRLAEALPARARVVCHDPNYTDAELAKFSAESPALRFSREAPGERFDLVLLLDVLEHVASPEPFLASLVERNLKPEGWLLVSVPAWAELFIRHDVMMGHHLRYRPRQLLEIVERAGLRTAEHGGVFLTLLLPRALQKLYELRRGVRSRPGDPYVPSPGDEYYAGTWSAGPAATAAVTAILSVDAAVSAWSALRGVRLPGLSTWAMCRRP